MNQNDNFGREMYNKVVKTFSLSIGEETPFNCGGLEFITKDCKMQVFKDAEGNQQLVILEFLGESSEIKEVLSTFGEHVVEYSDVWQIRDTIANHYSQEGQVDHAAHKQGMLDGSLKCGCDHAKIKLAIYAGTPYVISGCIPEDKECKECGSVYIFQEGKQPVNAAEIKE